MAATIESPLLDAAINEESHDYLEAELPQLLEAVKYEINTGKSPEQIYQYMMRQTQRPAIALRCRQAAAYLAEVEAHVNGADLPEPLRAR